MIKLDNCTGCMACVNSCPKKAIDVGFSLDGYLRPKVNEHLCINCENCVNICEGIKSVKSYNSFLFYSAQAKADEILINSTSGGVFQILAQKAFKEGWAVFGPVYVGGMELRHIRARNLGDIELMGGSKYVQSDMSKVMLEIKELLSSEKKVLFSGMPCQIAGLKSFLKFEMNSFNESCLLTVDFPCYGIPGVKFFQDTVKHYEKKYHGKMVDFRFRDKKRNGFSHTTVMVFEKKKKLKAITINDYRRIPYHYAFGERNCFQKKCYDCDFIKTDRVSDITLGSFWGIEKINNRYDTKKGVSMVCINTVFGESEFNRTLDSFIYCEQEAKEVYEANAGLSKKVDIGNRDNVINDYIKNGYKYIIKKYYRLALKNKLLMKLSNRQIEFLRKILKRKKS